MIALLSTALLSFTHAHGWVRALEHFGTLGLGLLCVVDASFVPLPIPGSADLMLALMAAKQHTWLTLTCVATLGSVLGGAACYYVGALGGMQLVEKRVPPRYFQRMTHWLEKHAYLAVSIPAILPPPFPLIPFVMAAGALKMPARKFYPAFALSRMLRHAFFAWLGMHYAEHLQHVWKLLTSPWATVILIVFWVLVIAAVTYGIVKLIKTQRAAPTSSRAASTVSS